jgi:hypothetical protein
MVVAIVENEAGRRDAALVAVRDAVARAIATETLCYVEPLRHRLGELLGGDEGRALVQHAIGSLEAQGIRDPRRWVDVHLPGTWGVPVTASPRTDDRVVRSAAT